MGYQFYPIVQDAPDFCPGKCKTWTVHACKIYPDVEYHTCLTCGHKKTLYYDRTAGRELVEADREKVARVEDKLNDLYGEIARHHWSINQGKKDRDFVDYIMKNILRAMVLIKEIEGVDDDRR